MRLLKLLTLRLAKNSSKNAWMDSDQSLSGKTPKVKKEISCNARSNIVTIDGKLGVCSFISTKVISKQYLFNFHNSHVTSDFCVPFPSDEVYKCNAIQLQVKIKNLRILNLLQTFI